MSDILLKPTPGFRYSVIFGDSLEAISNRAYGVDIYVKNILAANAYLTGRIIDSNGLPLIYAEDILIIPVLVTPKSKILTGKQSNELTILIEGKEIKTFSANMIRTMDTGADAINVSIAWIPGADKGLDDSLLPFKYPKAEIFIGGKLQLTGYLYTVRPSLSISESVIELTIFSLTKDAVDSTINPPYEKNNITLEQRAQELLPIINIQSIFEVDSGGQFDRITANQSDTIFKHLADLAAQRGILVSCTEKGEMLFYRADIDSLPVGTIKEGESLGLEYAAEYDGTKLFNTYKAVGDTPGADAQTAVAIDENVPKSRMITFHADDTTDGNILKAAEWKRSKKYADALTFSIPVSGWIAPNGELWKPNTTVILESPTLFLSNGVKLMIRSVEYLWGNEGLSVVLNLTSLEVFTGEPINYIWSVE